MIPVAVVDDDAMLVDGLRTWLADAADLRLVAAAPTVADLLYTDDARRVSAGVVLLDLMLRDNSDPAINVRRLVEARWRVLVVSVWSQPGEVAATFAAGARGYLTKDRGLPALGEAIRHVAAGETVYSPELAYALLRDPRPAGPHLSPQERAVLLAYASGMTLASTARHLGIRLDTANTYLKRVKAKYQQIGRPAHTKLDLANRVREDGLARDRVREDSLARRTGS
ncbi:MAG TPA: response regulator transcription factor [Pilimelia sp.]|nr:response regulator transcription factor [Pilimelia sp.]